MSERDVPVRKLTWILVPTVLGVAALGAVLMVWARAEPERQKPTIPAPLVRVREVALEDARMFVTSQGTVSPRTESRLIPEVPGRVVWVSPSFVSGGFFENGEVLLRIDDHDFRQAVVQAEAEVARAKLRLAQEEAEAEVARKEWEELGNGEPNPLTLRVPQIADARATVAAAEAALDRRRRDLERTEIRAPYAGRVRSKNADVGQFVAVGSVVGSIYAIDYAEIRLPLPDRDLAFLELPLFYRGGESNDPGPRVVLRAKFAGGTHEWKGRIVRTEGEVDPLTRLVHVVARVKDPYGRGADRARPPLAAGMFVDAEIEGTLLRGGVVLPREALRGTDRVWVVDRDDRLRFRDVDVYRTTDEEVFLRSGLEPGEKVCLSPLEAVTDGMTVRLEGAASDAGSETSAREGAA